MGQATLMFGIGATKAGTSWLYRYLDSHPDCAMPDPKELHYFDRLEFGSDAGALRSLDRRLDKIGTKLKACKDPDRADALVSRAARLKDWKAVLSKPTEAAEGYLDYLYRDAGQSTKLVADITPAYALLPETRLARMAQLAATTRFVYILRDPIDRLWSNIRMMAARRAKWKGQIPDIAHRIARDVVDGQERQVTLRSDYAGTLGRLDKAVRAETLFIGFFETLFSNRTIEALCRFLGIAPMAANVDAPVHRGVGVPLDPGMRQALARRMAPQYAAVEARFGSMPDAWRKNMVKV